MNDPFEQTIHHYLCRWRPTRRPRTIQGKGYLLRGFAAYLRQHHPEMRGFRQLQRQPHIEGWLQQRIRLAAVSRNFGIRTLRDFFQDLIDWQWHDAPPPQLLREEDLAPEPLYLPRPLPPALDQAVQDALMEAGTFGAMALLLLRYTGMRIGEMRALTLNAMQSSAPGVFTLRIPVGKTYCERLIPLDHRTVELIQRLLAQRACRCKQPLPAAFNPLLMIDPLGRHFSRDSYGRVLKKLTAHLHSTENIHCHRLRHTFATEMARTGMPVPALMKLLGHQTPRMTMQYVEVAQVDLRQAYDQALTQLSVIRSVQTRTLPTLPTPSATLPPQPDSNHLLKFTEALIAHLESHRRDEDDPRRARQLHRFIKRMRKACYSLKKIL